MSDRNEVNMKLMFVIIRDEDDENVVQALVKNNYRVTRVASTGGFLRHGNVTLMIGTEDDKVQEVIDLLREVCCPVEDSLHRATIFVVGMSYFEQI
jgi:uncharacterized protein YaaQ